MFRCRINAAGCPLGTGDPGQFFSSSEALSEVSVVIRLYVIGMSFRTSEHGRFAREGIREWCRTLLFLREWYNSRVRFEWQ